MKLGAYNLEKALVGTLFVIVKTSPMVRLQLRVSGVGPSSATLSTPVPAQSLAGPDTGDTRHVTRDT